MYYYYLDNGSYDIFYGTGSPVLDDFLFSVSTEYDAKSAVDKLKGDKNMQINLCNLVLWCLENNADVKMIIKSIKKEIERV